MNITIGPKVQTNIDNPIVGEHSAMLTNGDHTIVIVACEDGFRIRAEGTRTDMEIHPFGRGEIYVKTN